MVIKDRLRMTRAQPDGVRSPPFHSFSMTEREQKREKPHTHNAPHEPRLLCVTLARCQLMRKNFSTSRRIDPENKKILLRLDPFKIKNFAPERPPYPRFLKRDSPTTYTVCCTPGEQNLKVGGGGIFLGGISSDLSHLDNPPVRGPKIKFALGVFFLLQFARW